MRFRLAELVGSLPGEVHGQLDHEKRPSRTAQNRLKAVGIGEGSQKVWNRPYGSGNGVSEGVLISALRRYAVRQGSLTASESECSLEDEVEWYVGFQLHK